MSKVEVESKQEKPKKLDKVKKIIKKNWKPFTIGAGTTLVVVGTAIVLRRVIFPRYLYMCNGGTNFIMHRPILHKSPVYHVTNMHGAPYNRLSRAVRNVETGHETLSIAQMARDMGLNRSQVNQHLNFPEMHPHVKELHFESIGYIQPNKGNWGLSSV